jgi:centromere protein C
LADDTGDVHEAEPESEEEAEDEEEPPTKPSPVQNRKRGRPVGKAAALQQHDEEEDETPRRAAKRRRSNNPGEPEPSEPEPKKSAGRPRGRPPAAAKQTTSESNQASASTAQKPKGKRGRPAKPAAARRSESPAAAGADTSLAVVPRGPPLPKSRGLLIKRRVEVPGSNDGILRTRSGRNSFKPLAFWRNEHVDYDQDAATEDVSARGKKVGKVLLPTVKEIVRVEQEEAPAKKKSSGYKSKSSASSKSKRGGPGSDPFFDPEPADPWEEEPGTVTGDAVVWRTEYDWFPPTLEDEVEVEPEQLAVSGRAIQTREIRNASFRFAKTLSMPFFGAGVVDLPPGAEKRPKNSRKMYMAFFVFSGRVLVTVNETSFRISRGGMWFVPRGELFWLSGVLGVERVRLTE